MNYADPSSTFRAQSLCDILCKDIGQRFFGDGPPHWTLGKREIPAKTYAEASHERELVIKALRREKTAEPEELAAHLATCRLRDPCLSGACPVCGRAAQRLLTHAMRDLFDDYDHNMLAMNVVWGNAAVPIGQLNSDDIFAPTRTHLKRALDDVQVRAIGGFDISANDHEADFFEPYWSPHAYIFVPRNSMERNEPKFDRWFPPDDCTSRPIRKDVFDGATNGLAYALKPDFFNRITLLRRRLPNDGRSFGTRTKLLYREKRIELALALDRAGLDARLFLHGFQLVAAKADVTIIRAHFG